jgi:hypothetical protein
MISVVTLGYKILEIMIQGMVIRGMVLDMVILDMRAGTWVSIGQIVKALTS